MKRNMKQWVTEQIHTGVKKPVPLLSFPSVQLMGISVRELISDSTRQAEGMKLIADRVGSGAAVSLMDLSLEAEAFGSAIRVSDDEVPTVVGAIVTDEDEADALQIPEVGAGRTGIYLEAITRAVEKITDRPVFAGVIGPYSLAGRLMDVSEIMILCYEEPDMVHTVMEKVTAFLIEYCRAYERAGANGVIIAEPLAGLLSPNLAREFAHPYVQKVIEAVQHEEFAVFYHNCGDNVPLMAKDIYALGAMGYHFGDAIRLADMFADAPEDVLVMGNVSPAAQFCNGTPDSMQAAVQDVIAQCGKYPNFLLSSGCDIPPISSWENIDAFFRAAEGV